MTSGLSTARNEIHETALPNGLRVIVKEDHRAPVVVSQLWYRVGSIDEPAGVTGISHLLEHMMFKGTARHGPGEFSRIVAENGGRENAFTGPDHTVYYQQLEQSRLPIALELEADRMRDLAIDDAEFHREREVVKEERRLHTDDQPEAVVEERFMAAAYGDHPYGHPVIGWMPDLERLRARDLRAWYRRWYAPDNAVLVLVGDVRRRDAEAFAGQHFGPIPARAPAPAPLAPVPPGGRAIEVRVPAQVPYLILGYLVPVLTPGIDDWRPYALSLLTGILDGGQAARLPREVVRGQKVAAGLDVDYEPVARARTVFAIRATPAAGRSVTELAAAIRAQIDRVRDRPVPPSELERVKIQSVAADVYHRDSMFSQALEIGRLAATGLDPRLAGDYARRLGAVTAEQVQAVARECLDERYLTVATLEPLPDGPRGP